MPVGSGPNNGSFPMVVANPVKFQDGVTLTGDTTTEEVISENCPSCHVWVLQSAGPGTVTVTVQFANGRGAGDFNWRALASFPIALNVVSRTSYILGSIRYRLVLSISGGNATLGWRLTATPTS